LNVKIFNLHLHSEGSLIYEQLAYRPITVNPQYFNFYRKFNLTHITQGLQILEKYQKLYDDFCQQITSFPSIQPVPHIVFYKAPRSIDDHCKDENSILPEIKTSEDAGTT